MATWGGSRDGQIVPNNYFRQNATTATTSSTNNNTSSITSNSSGIGIGIGGNCNNGGDTGPGINTAAAANVNVADDLDCFFGPFDTPVPDLQSLAEHPTPRHHRLSFSPQSSLLNSDSFAAGGDTFSGPFHTTPNTNTAGFPLLQLGDIFHDPLYPPPSQFLPPTTPASASSYHGPNSSVGPPQQFGSVPDDYCSFALRQSQQLPLPSDFRGGNRNSYQSNATPLLSLATALSQSHMNNVNSQQIPPTSRPRSLSRVPEFGRFDGFDDFYISALAQDFSSPSLPPLSSSPPPPPVSLPSFGRLRTATGQEMPLSSNRRRIISRVGLVDLAKQEPDIEVPNSVIDSSTPVATMPPLTRMRSQTGTTDSPVRKRRSSVTAPSTRPNKARRKGTPIGSDPFDIDVSKSIGPDDYETVDLSNATEVPVELRAPKVDNRVKISKFQCVICMDDTTALAVTHCGHLFCSGCLHSSLHIDSMKRTCPVCRSKVDLKDKKGKTIKSFHHLELKVMTATKKGKRPAGA